MSFWLIYTAVFIMAALPAGVWLFLFLRHHKENRWVVLAAFMAGMIAAKLILIYQGYWDMTVNLVFAKLTFIDFRTNIQELIVDTFLAAILTFIGVGVMEEMVKFWMMKWVGKRFFKSIDDVILLAIVTALGFAFFENMVYFSHQWGQLANTHFTLFVLSRVTIVTMVHVLCSGVMGYYFGMAFFADPILAIEHARRKKHPSLEMLHKILHLKKSVIYHDEMIMKGLLFSVALHALYDFLLFPQLNLPSFILVILMLIYFFGGYQFLVYLIQKKDDQLKLGMVQEAALSPQQLERLIDEVQLIKDIRTSQVMEVVLDMNEGRKSRKQSRFLQNNSAIL